MGAIEYEATIARTRFFLAPSGVIPYETIRKLMTN